MSVVLDPQLESLAKSGTNFITEPTLKNGSLKAFYEENGYLVVPNALSKEELRELNTEALRICKGERGVFDGLLDFAPEDTDDDILRRYLCIHFPHKMSEIMLKYLSTPKMVETLVEIIGPNVKCMQSMLFIKASGKPGQAWHQDEDFIPTRDRSLTGGWIALDRSRPNKMTALIVRTNRRSFLIPMRTLFLSKSKQVPSSSLMVIRCTARSPTAPKVATAVFWLITT
jgi:ectoine hydroxylase-related dioxygenase (phytanoyl-CoA dioxygenase family)